MNTALSRAAAALSLPLTLSAFFITFKALAITEAYLDYRSCITTHQLNFPATTAVQAHNACAKALR